jgi:membrane-associated phospholipid phosphatase
MTRSLIIASLICIHCAAQVNSAESRVPRKEAVSTTASAEAVVEWNQALEAIVRTPGTQPATIHSTRSFAILHAAMFDAVNSIARRFRPYLVSLPAVSQQASQLGAADQAAHDVLVFLYPQFQAALDAELAQDLEQIPDGPEKAEGIDAGRTVAAEILAARANDGSTVMPPPYVAGTLPGDYQLTPPNFAAADFTQWPQVALFALKRADDFRPPPPPVLTSEEYTEVFTEVRSLGFIKSATRTADQTQIGLFWNGSIQNFWNEIAQAAAIGRRLDLVRSAHLFALLDITLADTAIAFFEGKYFYNVWRPVTAVRAAGSDGNPDTMPDPSWLPLTTKTAPDPSYPGAHSAISAAAAEVLKLELGERFTFDVTSESLPGVSRHFTSFDEAAREAGLSRIYAGQHFRSDHVAGRQLGRQVARSIVRSILLAQ